MPCDWLSCSRICRFSSSTSRTRDSRTARSRTWAAGVSARQGARRRERPSEEETESLIQHVHKTNPHFYLNHSSSLTFPLVYIRVRSQEVFTFSWAGLCDSTGYQFSAVQQNVKNAKVHHSEKDEQMLLWGRKQVRLLLLFCIVRIMMIFTEQILQMV